MPRPYPDPLPDNGDTIVFQGEKWKAGAWLIGDPEFPERGAVLQVVRLGAPRPRRVVLLPLQTFAGYKKVRNIFMPHELLEW